MEKKLPLLFFIFLFCFSQQLSSQTYQLIGNPVNTTGWTMVGPTVVSTDFVQLTPDVNDNSGSIRLNEPINLKYCDKWRIEFDFRMDSSQTYNGDGIAFWYLANPPVASVLGSGIGVSQNAVGFIVGFDTYNNATGSSGMSKVHVAYGQVQNTTDTNNVEFFNIPGSSFHSPDLNATLPFQGTTYKHVEVTAEVDPAAPANWIVKITLNGTVICNQSFAPSGAAAAMTVGYFGFSASTGGARSRHSIKNVKVYVDKIPLLESAITKSICPDLAGMATVDLTTFNSQLTATPNNYNFTYYITGSGTPIANPTNFQYNADTNISVVIKDPATVLCDNNDATITLKVAPTVTATDATLRSCFIESKPSTGLFNLTTAAVIGTSTGIIKTYYPSLTDAENGTNEIVNPTNYIAPTGVVYIKVTNSFGCYDIAKVNLVVMAPVFSNILEDKIICIEDKTTLDAGPGFTSYEWSTGATTQAINDVGVGTYWVKLKTGECITTQSVKVYASEQPVISSVDISNNTVSVYAVGGTAPYQYSMDGINWQDSNEFKNVPRGDSKIYVKDAYDCEPIDISIVVPNLINVITPNGDGINDAIDYSALAGKQNLVFNVFDRYGAQIHHADKSNKYRWDGTVGGRKISTGSYWYSVSWNENDKKNTPFRYSGWVLVKNRD
ncbi:MULTISPECIES: lectin-like domain-containing protein [Chryseobacterium]|uniref:Gliding motility-associated-like protein n=1 Tax=Chryseobacterium geocarposphaerae TaxID=1416776 RepID=A0ABU1LF89_9FLAO|nr:MULTISPECIES: T9SS type B sorting domain-containing protein [Chryseobacterium]MDR6405397.1 gliding motility-associated-like protein [Chryseobacterium geocarposphaerae]MDR6697556.1 gliding motility-associated-like protein [Chryseobacterium ginsenosidimutans]